MVGGVGLCDVGCRVGYRRVSPASLACVVG